MKIIFIYILLPLLLIAYDSDEITPAGEDGYLPGAEGPDRRKNFQQCTPFLVFA